MSRPARGLALLLATVLLLAPVMPFAAVGGAAAAPAGMSTIPDANVAQDVPAGETIPLSAAELEGGVMASEHADSLDVVLTTADHAASVMNADSAVVSGDGMAVVLRDDQQSAGREVALDAGRLQQALGYRPEAIYGTHEDGEQWTASAEYVDGYLVFDVPHFSSNTVTFSGEVEIVAQGATNNTQFEYEVGDNHSVSNGSLQLTGVLNEKWNNISKKSVSDGSTIDASIGGNKDPAAASVTFEGTTVETWNNQSGYNIAPDGSASIDVSGNYKPGGPGGSPSLSLTADAPEQTYNPLYDEGDGTLDNPSDVNLVGDDSSFHNNPYKSELQVVPDSTGKLTQVDVGISYVYGDSYNYNVDVYLSQGSPDGSLSKGTKIADWYPDHSTGTKTINLHSQPIVQSGQTYHLEFETTNSDNDDSMDTLEISNRDTSGGGNWAVFWGASGGQVYRDGYADIDLTIKQEVNNVEVTDGQGNSVYYGDLTDGKTETLDFQLSNESSSLDFQGSGLGEIDWELKATNRNTTVDPSVDIDGDGNDEASYSGLLGPGDTKEYTIYPTPDDDLWTVSTGGFPTNVNANVKERTETVNPSVEVTTDVGTQTVSHSGTLSDGSTVSLSDEIDESLIGGATTVTTKVDSPTSGPKAQFHLYYSHSAQDQISTSFQSSTFEETYNISHTYADATENAQVTIPFASERVVGVRSVEYRADGGSWSSVAPANYRLQNTTLDVYLDDATGGISAGQTIAVRATGRKISVDNGKVTVTDPTAPGEELDTELRIDSRQSDFAVNVGPTDDGDRVHYAYSPYFPTEDYVVIQSDGDQDLHLPNAVTGDRFRVRHLDTRVVAERGDVRIDVVKAGENPEFDVSPGPGGSGDPVTVEYYNTETGVKYLLNSLTRSIVVDSDVAESPAIFEDDDSEDTWAILTDSGASGSSSSSGAVGQFTERASGAVGSVSLPIDGSGLGQLALVGVLGLGGLLVLRRINPFGGSDSDSAAVTSSTSTGSASGSTLDRLTGLASTAGAVGSRAAQTTGSGLLAALRRLLAYFGQVATLILGNRQASITAGVVAAIVAARVGLVSLPEGTGILIVVAGVPVATWLILRQNNAASTRVWLGSTIAAVILGLEFVAPGTVQTAIEQLTSETVAPLLILVAAGGLYLWYRARQSDRPQIIIGGDSE